MTDLALKLYFASQIGLLIYSLHFFLLAILFLIRERQVRQKGLVVPSLREYPKVTVQLPIFNEARVVERLFEAAVNIRWPADQLEIQVLDDSTDNTKDLAAHWVEHHRQKGANIVHLHRTDRRGYKAGALHAGTAVASGEFIAVFDADFLPQPEFLEQLMPYLLEDPKRAFIQARWGHLNKNYSLVTRLQSIVIDSHFVIDQCVRAWAGFPMHFNGTAGIWRRAAVEDCSWQSDTLCEDLDLSYRAYMRGWKPCFNVDVVVPAELSPQLQAFRQQQFRWAKGSAQVLRKLLPELLASHLPWWQKALALVHISGYSINALLLLQLFLGPWAAATMQPQDAIHLGLLGICSYAACPSSIHSPYGSSIRRHG